MRLMMMCHVNGSEEDGNVRRECEEGEGTGYESGESDSD
jgi:hypothetical protein